jgi:hypothetical protein
MLRARYSSGIAIAVAALAFLYLTRYQVSGVTGGAAILDRWTGTVQVCFVSFGPCAQVFPRP